MFCGLPPDSPIYVAFFPKILDPFMWKTHKFMSVKFPLDGRQSFLVFVYISVDPEDIMVTLKTWMTSKCRCSYPYLMICSNIYSHLWHSAEPSLHLFLLFENEQRHMPYCKSQVTQNIYLSTCFLHNSLVWCYSQKCHFFAWSNGAAICNVRPHSHNLFKFC